MTAESTLQRDGLTWLNYLMMGFYSYLLNILGPITPFIRDELELSYTVGSFHFSAFALGMIAAGLLGERWVALLGRRRVFWGGGIGMLLGMLLLTLGRSPVITVTGALLMGSLGSLTFSLIPVFLTRHHPRASLRSLTEANLVASSFGFVAPFLVSFFAVWLLNWRAALWLTIPLWLALWLLYRRQTLPEPEATPSATGGASFGTRFWLRWLVVFLVVGIEFCILFWGPDFLRDTRSIDSSEAAAAAGFALVGMFLGRAAGSFLLNQWPVWLRFVASLALVLGGGLLLLTTTRAPLELNMLLIGLGVANLYPIAFDTSLRAVFSHHDAASSRLVMASGVAILGLPLIVGNLADQIGIEQALPLVVGVLLALVVSLFAALEQRAASSLVTMARHENRKD